MRSTHRTSLCLSAAIVACPGLAAARSVAVVPLVGSGSVDEEDLFQLGEVVSATLRERGHDVLGPVEAAERIDERLPGCIASRSPECWMAAASQMARDAIVHGRVQRDAPNGAATVTLTAIDVGDGRVLVESSHGGAAATRTALLTLARTAAAHLSDELPALQRHPRLRVETQPSGAALTVNGNPVGRTPWSAEVARGVTVIEARLAGHRRALREVTLATGQNRTLTLLLEPTAAGPTAPAGRAGWQLPVGVAGLVVGAAGVALGSYGLLRDGCLEANAAGACRREIGTGERVGLGVVPLTLGLAVATAGVVLGFVLEIQ
jgi:hypothetical protein